MTSNAKTLEIDRAFGLVREIGLGSGIAPSELIKLETVRRRLAEGKRRLTQLEILRWTAPILCTDKDAVNDYRAELANRFQQAAREEPTTLETPGDRKKPQVPWWRNPVNFVSLVLILEILLAAALPIVIWWFNRPANGPVSLPPVDDTSPPPPAFDSSPTAQLPEQFELVLRFIDGAISPLFISLLAGLALLLSGYVIWRYLQNQQIRRQPEPDLANRLQMNLDSGLHQLFQDNDVRKAIHALGYHREVASEKLDVRASLSATISNGGYPTLYFGHKPERPELIFMCEREAPSDLLADIGKTIGRRLREEDVPCQYYEFFGDPRHLRQFRWGAAAKTSSGDLLTLQTALSRQPDGNALVMMESHDCFPEQGDRSWLDRLAESDRPALLNPKPARQWSDEEHRLMARDITVVPLEVSGFQTYGERMASLEGGVHDRVAGDPEWDLPAGFAEDRAMLLDAESPNPMIIDMMVGDVEDYLDEPELFWLRSTALFPYLHPGLMIYLGRNIEWQGDDGPEPLFTEQRLIRLARLPWFRAGQMPDWLRSALVRGMTRQNLDVAVDRIARFLELPGYNSEESTPMEFLRAKRRFVKWMNLRPDHTLSDKLLIDAMKGRNASELGMSAPQTITHRARKLITQEYIMPVLAAITAALLVTGALLYLDRLYLKELDAGAGAQVADDPAYSAQQMLQLSEQKKAEATKLANDWKQLSTTEQSQSIRSRNREAYLTVDALLKRAENEILNTTGDTREALNQAVLNFKDAHQLLSIFEQQAKDTGDGIDQGIPPANGQGITGSAQSRPPETDNQSDGGGEQQQGQGTPASGPITDAEMDDAYKVVVTDTIGDDEEFDLQILRAALTAEALCYPSFYSPRSPPGLAPPDASEVEAFRRNGAWPQSWKSKTKSFLDNDLAEWQKNDPCLNLGLLSERFVPELPLTRYENRWQTQPSIFIGREGWQERLVSSNQMDQALEKFRELENQYGRKYVRILVSTFADQSLTRSEAISRSIEFGQATEQWFKQRGVPQNNLLGEGNGNNIAPLFQSASDPRDVFNNRVIISIWVRESKASNNKQIRILLCPSASNDDRAAIINRKAKSLVGDSISGHRISSIFGPKLLTNEEAKDLSPQRTDSFNEIRYDANEKELADALVSYFNDSTISLTTQRVTQAPTPNSIAIMLCQQPRQQRQRQSQGGQQPGQQTEDPQQQQQQQQQK